MEENKEDGWKIKKEYLKTTLEYNKSILDLVENRLHILLITLGAVIPLITGIILSTPSDEDFSPFLYLVYFISLLCGSFAFFLSLYSIRTIFPYERNVKSENSKEYFDGEYSNMFALTIKHRYKTKEDYMGFLSQTVFDTHELQNEFGGQIYKLAEIISGKVRNYQKALLLLGVSIVTLILGLGIRLLFSI